MPWTHTLSALAPWAGLSLLGLIFAANGLGILDQSVAVRELTATGLSLSVSRAFVSAGRGLQLIATPCLFYTPTRPWAALALGLCLIGATFTAHAFWKVPPPDRDRQLTQFLKNAAIVGGLLITAAWRP